MSEEAKETPGFGARFGATAVWVGAGLAFMLTIYFMSVGAMPMTISAEMAKSAGCPHLPPAGLRTTWGDHMFALRGLTTGGGCRELSAKWLNAQEVQWLWTLGTTNLWLGAVTWNKNRSVGIQLTGTGLVISAAAAWVSLAA